MNRHIIISCEHAGNEVPVEYRHLFKSGKNALGTHRGLDIGAMELTRTISEVLQREPYVHTISRLLVDLNRSLHNPTLFSEFTMNQPEEIRKKVLREYYMPYRTRIENRIDEIVEGGGQTLHLSVHTFTPVFAGKVREVDVGFLYDPSRPGEKKFCRKWRKKLSTFETGLHIKMNAPYKGVMDGFTTHLRERYADDKYSGIEIEVNQRFACSASKESWENVQKAIARSLYDIL